MEGILIFLNGTVQTIGQVQDIVSYIPVLEDLIAQLKQQKQQRYFDELQNLSDSEFEHIVKARKSIESI